MNRTRLLPVLLLLGSLGAAQSTAGGAAEIEQLQVKRDGGDVTIQVVLTPQCGRLCAGVADTEYVTLQP